MLTDPVPEIKRALALNKGSLFAVRKYCMLEFSDYWIILDSNAPVYHTRTDCQTRTVDVVPDLPINPTCI